MTPIVLYGERLWDSPSVFTVFVALEEKGLAYETRALDLTAREHKSASFAKVSFAMRVPAIEDDGFALSESLAIVDYLDEAFPEARRVLPAAPREKARARAILAWLRSDLGPLREERPTTTMFFEPATNPLSPAGHASRERLVEIAERLLPEGAPTLFDQWSIADADLAFMLSRLVLNGDPLPARLERYARDQWARASVQRFVAMPRPSHRLKA